MAIPRTTRRSLLGGGLALTAGVALSACSSNTDNATVPSQPDQVSGELNILVSSATGSDAGFKAVNSGFAKKYANVKINFTAIPNEDYNQARTARLSAGSIDVGLAFPKELPDYVPAGNEGDDARLADAGGFVDLTSQPFVAKFNPTVMDEIKYKGKNYTLPTGLSYYTGMMYNKAIFSKYSVSIPNTWDDFLSLCDTLKGKGVQPLGIGGKDTAGINALALCQSLYPTAQDKQDLAKGLYGYTVALNTGTQLQLLQQLSKIYGLAEPNFAGVNYATMTSDFINGKFAMMNDGTWNVTSLQEGGKGKLDFGYFPLPASNTATDNAFLGGKVELSLAIPSNTKNLPAAMAWLEFFADNYQLFNDKAGFAPSQTGVNSNEFYSGIANYTSTFQPAWDTIWIPNTKAGPAAQIPWNWAGLEPMGNLDVQAAADASQKDWEAGK